MTDSSFHWSDRLTARLRRVQDTRRRFRASVGQPRPTVQLDLPLWMPCWVIRLGGVAFGAGALLVLHPNIFSTVVLTVTLVVLAVRSNAATGAVFCGALGLAFLVGPPNVWPADAAAIALGAAAWTVAGVISGLTWGTRIELAVLLPALWRYLTIQAITQLLLAGALLLRSQHVTGSVPAMIALACGAAIAAAGWLIVPRLSHTRQ